jgi:hypothetical protein
MPAYLSAGSQRKYQNLNLYQDLHLFPSENFICCRCGFLVQQKILGTESSFVNHVACYEF